MDPLENPYTPHAGSPPAELAGRDRELEHFRILVGRLKRGHTEQSMIIRGLRGVGKTVLLNAFESQAEAEGFVTFYHEVTPETRLMTTLIHDAQTALTRLRLSARLRNRVREALSLLSAVKLTGPGGFELSVDLTRADEPTMTDDLSTIFVEVGRAAQENGVGVAFFLDEVQFVREAEYRALISALHRATQKTVPVTVAAAGLPQIPRLSGDARSYAERLFTFPEIGSLGEDDARVAFVEPAAAKDVHYTTDAIDAALEWTEGYPFYLQQLGKHAWNLARRSPVGVDVIREAVPAAQAALDTSIYEVRVQRATEQERRYMRAMAELGAGPYKAGDIARTMGRRTTAVSPIRQSLLEKGLIYATEDFGYVDFTIPRFDEFMRRHVRHEPASKKTLR